MTGTQILIDAAFGRAVDLLLDLGWTQHAMARDGAGERVSVDSEHVGALCLVGSMRRAAFELTHDESALTDVCGHVPEKGRAYTAILGALHYFTKRVLQEHRGQHPNVTETQWNDAKGRTKVEVVGALRTARVAWRAYWELPPLPGMHDDAA